MKIKLILISNLNQLNESTMEEQIGYSNEYYMNKFELMGHIPIKKELYNVVNNFSEHWNSGIRGKLECYSVPKLHKLAKTKNLKKFYSFTKKQLVDELEKISFISDFPIK